MLTGTKSLALQMVLLLCAVLTTPLFAANTTEPNVQQTALVFRVQDVQNRQLPASIFVRGHPVIYGSQVSLACMALHAWKDDLVVFLPASSSCIPLTDLFTSGLESDLSAGGYGAQQRDRARLEKELESNFFARIQTSIRTKNTSVIDKPVIQAGVCDCPSNVAPVLTVTSGAIQQVSANASIASIGFSATDSDSEVLTDYFSYKLDGGPSTEGLPAGLLKQCASVTGQLDCTVTGTAPSIAGVYLLTLEVLDGFNRVSKTVSLTVTAGDIEAASAEDAPDGGIAVGLLTSCNGNEVVRTFNIIEVFTVGDINVGFNADHNSRGDIKMSLRSPMGTLKVLTDLDGGANDNYDILLDDDRGGLLDSGTDDNTAEPYYDRTVRQSQLNDFEGEPAHGIWTMKICDVIPDAGDGTYRRARLDISAVGHVPGAITVSAISGNTSEDGASASFTVVLDSGPSADVSIDLSSSDPGEGSVLPTSLIFNAGNWSTPQVVTVTGIDDAIQDGNVAYSIITHPSVSVDTSYSGINAADVMVLNLDNDADSIGCDIEYVKLDKHSLVINVEPSGLDDTMNIQCALNAAVKVGMPIVRLGMGDFYVQYLFAEKFNGSLLGTTRAGTRLHIINGGIDCAAMATAGLTPAALKFSQGEPVLKFMTLTADSPCISGDPLHALIHFTGRNGNDPNCGFSVINARVDRVDFVGPGRGGHITNAIAATAEAEYLGGCHDALLGGIKVNFSSVTDTVVGVLTGLRSAAQIDINFSTFEQIAYSIVLLDSNQSTTVTKNVFNFDEVEPAIGYAAGIFVVTSIPDAPAKTRLVVHNNVFNLTETSGYPVDAIKVSQFGDSTQDVSTSITNNTFTLAGTNMAGVWGVDVSNATISANTFNGYGFGAIGLQVNQRISVEGTTITSNKGLGNFTGNLADIFIGAGVMKTFVGSGQNATSINEGNDNLILSSDPYDSGTEHQHESGSGTFGGIKNRSRTATDGLDSLLQLLGKK